VGRVRPERAATPGAVANFNFLIPSHKGKRWVVLGNDAKSVRQMFSKFDGSGRMDRDHLRRLLRIDQCGSEG
jgi:hypothetical protein